MLIIFEECYEVRNKKPYLRATIVALRRNVTFIMTVPCTLLFAHVAHSSREDIHVHVQSEGRRPAVLSVRGRTSRQSTIAIQTEVDEDAITVSWQVPRHNDVGGAHILHRTASNPGGRG